MEATVALVLVLGVVTVGMTLLLAVGYVSTEKERAAQEQARRAEAALSAEALCAEPGFFVPPPRVAAPMTLVFDDALVNRLESHVRMEQVLVADFVHHPSIENLNRRPAAPLHVH